MVSEIPVCLPEERKFPRADVKITELEIKKEKKKVPTVFTIQGI